MSSEIKISVIIPMHDAEADLRPCIDSLINQTLKDFEIICVDDGSKDNTIPIIEEYMQQDERIKLIKRENSGAGMARNVGLKEAKGEYLLFLDSDDFFEAELLRLTYEKAKKTEADIVLFDGRWYDNATGEYTDVTHYLRKSMLPDFEPFNRKDFPETDLLYITNPAPWTKLYKKAFIEEYGLEFQNIQNANDVYFSFSSVCRAEKIAVVNERLMNYRINRKGSIQHQKKKAPCCFIEAYQAIYEKTMEWGIYEEIKKGFICNFLSSGVYSLNSFKGNDLKRQVAYGLKDSMLGSTDALDMPPAYYLNKEMYFTIKSVIKGVKWHEKCTKRQAADIRVIGENKRNKKAKVSVIIPVYNVEKYLEECLDSVVNQTLKDIEIICVNDASKDNSLDILKKYADKDDRIIIMDKVNGGPSSARNAGLDIADGEYIYYLDSDDYLEPDALQILYDKCAADDLDMVFFNAETFISEDEDKLDAKIPSYIKKNDYSQIVSGIDYIVATDANNEYSSSPVLQMIKREYLEQNKFRFYEGIIHEDDLYTFMALLKAKRVTHVNSVLYHRRMHAGSIVTTLSFEHCYGYFVDYCQMMELLENLDDVDEEKKYGLYELVYRILFAARSIFAGLKQEGNQYLIFLEQSEYYKFFAYIFSVADNEAKIEAFSKEREGWIKERERLIKEKDTFWEQRDVARKEREEFIEELRKTREEKNEINRQLQQRHEDMREANEKLKKYNQDRIVLLEKIQNANSAPKGKGKVDTKKVEKMEEHIQRLKSIIEAQNNIIKQQEQEIADLGKGSR